MQPFIPHKLNEAQVNLIKSFMFLHDEREISEIDALINFYLEKKLDDAIEVAETERQYTASIYEEWLNSNTRNR